MRTILSLTVLSAGDRPAVFEGRDAKLVANAIGE
jgi:hypothetical protein